MRARLEFYLEKDDTLLAAHEGKLEGLIVPVAGDTICFVAGDEGIPYKVESRDILYMRDAGPKAVQMRVQIFVSAEHGMIDPSDFPIEPWKKQETVY